MTPNHRGYMEHLPPEDFRLHDEEIKCASEYERDSQTSHKPEAQKKSSAASSQMASGSSTGSLDSEDSFDFVAPERKDLKEKKSQESDQRTMNSEQDVSASAISPSIGNESIHPRGFQKGHGRQAGGFQARGRPG